jgi:hypothetical protein
VVEDTKIKESKVVRSSGAKKEIDENQEFTSSR